MGRILVVPALGYMVALGSSLMGGPSLPSVLVPGQAQDAETASYVEFRDGVVVTPEASEDAAAVPSAEEASSAPDDGQVAIREVSSEANAADADVDAERSASKRPKGPAGAPGAKKRGRGEQADGAARPEDAGDGASNAGGRSTKPKGPKEPKRKTAPADPSTPGTGTEPGNVPGV